MCQGILDFLHSPPYVVPQADAKLPSIKRVGSAKDIKRRGSRGGGLLELTKNESSMDGAAAVEEKKEEEAVAAGVRSNPSTLSNPYP